MWKHRWSVAAMALCLQCGGSTQSAPAEEPATESENTEETPAPSGEAESAGTDEESRPSESSDATSEAKPAGGKKSCADLKKGDCKVTAGCAWNSLGKCVEEGASE